MSIGTHVHRVLRERVQLLGSVLAVRTHEPLVVMTYDDGPEPPHTEHVLESLSAHGAHATFFMLSQRARQHRSLVQEILAEGHELALHGLDHRPLAEFSAAEVTRRTLVGRAMLEEIAGVEVRWMRPPYGRQTPRSYAAIRRAGLMPVLWGGTSLDSADTDTDSRLQSALRHAAPGLILLNHDGRAGLAEGVDDGDIRPFHRGELSDRLLDGLRERGLAATSLERALVHGRSRLGAWFG